MAPVITWRLPAGADSRQLVAGAPGGTGVAARGDRPATPAYLGQLSRTAEQLGFAAVLAPGGPGRADPWLTSAMLAGGTDRLAFVVPVRPGSATPAHLAGLTATFQDYFPGRLRLVLLPAEGGTWDRTTELAEELRALLRNPPPLWIDGPVDPDSPARHADVVLVDGDTPPELAARSGRLGPVRIAVRLHVITRDTSGEAWAEARRLLATLRTISNGQNGHRVNGADAARFERYPNLWSGAAPAPDGARLTLVGNHAEVADRIDEYRRLGVEEFVLSGHPHLESAYWFAEGVLPRLADDTTSVISPQRTLC